MLSNCMNTNFNPFSGKYELKIPKGIIAPHRAIGQGPRLLAFIFSAARGKC